MHFENSFRRQNFSGPQPDAPKFAGGGLFCFITADCGRCRLYEMQDDDEEAERMPSVSERIKQMESKKIRFSAMRDTAAKRR